MRCVENPAVTVVQWIKLTGIKIWIFQEIIGEVEEDTKMWGAGDFQIPDKTFVEMNNRQCVEVSKRIRGEDIQPALSSTH